MIDGEAVVLGVDGVADFNALHSRKHDDEVQLYAFDILALDGDGSAPPALVDAAWSYFARPAGWVWRGWSRSAGTGPIRPVGWLKVKNRKHPAMKRVEGGAP